MAGPAAPVVWGTAPTWHASRSQDQPQGTVWLCLLLLLPICVSAPVTNPINPGIKAWLTQRTLDFGRRFGLELLQSMLQKEHELNLAGSYNTPLLGTLTYAVPRIHIHELQMNESTLDFAEDVGVRLKVQRARIQLSADWAAQLGAIQDSGSVELRMQDLALAAVLGVSEDGSGHPTVWSAGCDTHGTELHMEFHRGYSWLYNLLVPLLQRTLRQRLNKELCLMLHRGIDRLDAVLKHMKVSTQLDTFAAIDYSLLGPPAFTEEYGDIALKGEIFRVGSYQQRASALPVGLPVALPMALPVALPTPLPMTPPMEHEPMLLLAVTEFVANSAAFTYFTAGALHRKISMLPRRFPLQLSTKSMEVFSPQLQERYPDQPMELHLWARQQPLLSCHPDALHGTLFSSAEAFVVLHNATRVPAFLLNIDANMTGKPTITRNRLGGTVRLTGLHVTQVASSVGPVEVKRLETVLKFGLWLFGVPQANKWLRAGIPLPLPQGLSLLRPRLSLHQGFVLIATDLQYEP
ncbi:PREDICTED: bactericidal permeability-increasing protein-like [Ficedula albicollis]|uniref:bactericidal permeability-increasing protein-like n=1 Tax=Ficedula albicollis TaxID=59894 RepID=UPI0007AD8B33|nr:PREDICTED: bactericidal permeability-increasing protein-like [Ficedula albicollis]